MLLSEYINGFDSCDRIAKGGQKKVFKAVKKGITYAFKVIQDCDDKRVLQEIEILRQLNIKGVPQIIDVGVLEDGDEQVLYILEEFIHNDSLRKRVEEKKYLSLKQAYKILFDLLTIEIELEKNGIIHRDIKPDNILLTEEGETYLIDFGVAKVIGKASLTAVDGRYGPHTPGYAPYEQIMNDRLKINSKTDLYQIGITLYELISGVNPFKENATSHDDIVHRTVRLIPEKLVIVGDDLGRFSAFISMLMSKNQSQRPENAKKALEYLLLIEDTLKMEDI